MAKKYTAYVKESTNTSGISYKADMITAAEDEVEDSLDDKISKVEDDFEYILDGISQLDMVQGNEILNSLNESLQEYIQEIAGYLA